ncbi:hypothetical protein PR202_ga10339 [Eleusine coracana subsp. coracana]|uniref:Uncharacterized protein n=1 Tax=Eleusine coracana subsp. coracana TaxID=191504 RepID=A0AAV5C6J4_ELECO|nr:hypothetical protein PR202_ga10339 [Eleusine coracana subsp. coracana]
METREVEGRRRATRRCGVPVDQVGEARARARARSLNDNEPRRAPDVPGPLGRFSVWPLDGFGLGGELNSMGIADLAGPKKTPGSPCVAGQHMFPGLGVKLSRTVVCETRPELWHVEWRVSDLEETAALEGTAYEVKVGFVCSVWFLW